MMGAIFAKLWRAHMVFRTGMAMTRIRVSVMETVHIVLVVVHAVVLVLWMVLDPPYWQQTVLETDGDGCVLSSTGECSSTLGSPFVMSLLFMNVGLMGLGGFFCYKSRNIPDKFQEGSSVGFAVFLISQLYIIGIPVLVLVKEDPTIRLYVSVGIVFLVVAVVLSMMFGNLLSLLYFRSEESVASSIANHIRNHSFTNRMRRSRMPEASALSLPSSLSLKAGQQRSSIITNNTTKSVVCEGSSANEIPGGSHHNSESGAIEAMQESSTTLPATRSRFWASLESAATEWESLLVDQPDVLEKEDVLGEASIALIQKLEVILNSMKDHNQSRPTN